MEILLPTVEDALKVGSGGGAGLGVMAFIARMLKGDIRRAQESQSKINEKFFQLLQDYGKDLNAHAQADAEKFASRQELADLRDHIDVSFRDQRDFFLKLIRGGPGQ